MKRCDWPDFPTVVEKWKEDTNESDDRARIIAQVLNNWIEPELRIYQSKRRKPVCFHYVKNKVKGNYIQPELIGMLMPHIVKVRIGKEQQITKTTSDFTAYRLKDRVYLRSQPDDLKPMD